MEKHKNTILTIVGVLAIALVVQFVRFKTQISKLTAGMGAIIPANYFPFNGTYEKNLNGDIKRA